MTTKRTDDLMRALQSAPVFKTNSPDPKPKKVRKVVTSGKGKPMNLYLHPEDTQRIRSLAAYLTGQGFRVSDSQVVKAALRVAAADSTLLSAYEKAVTTDQRFKRSTGPGEE